MRTAHSILIAIVFTSCAHTTTLSPDAFRKNRGLFEKASGDIRIGRIEARQDTHEYVFALAEQRAKANDPSGRGVRIFVPPQFQKRYENELKDLPVTCTLGPNLSLMQFAAEFPVFADWLLCPWTADSLAIVPRDAFVQDD